MHQLTPASRSHDDARTTCSGFGGGPATVAPPCAVRAPVGVTEVGLRHCKLFRMKRTERQIDYIPNPRCAIACNTAPDKMDPIFPPAPTPSARPSTAAPQTPRCHGPISACNRTKPCALLLCSRAGLCTFMHLGLYDDVTSQPTTNCSTANSARPQPAALLSCTAAAPSCVANAFITPLAAPALLLLSTHPSTSFPP